jgi:hypothetical protein
LTGLRRLDLQGCSRLTDVEALRGLNGNAAHPNGARGRSAEWNQRGHGGE